MARQILERIASSVVICVALTLFVFLAFFRIAHGGGRGRQAPIHGPVLDQYGHYVWRIVRHGDLGHSSISHQAVGAQLMDGAPVTLSLVAGGLVVWLLLSVPLGLLSALRPRSFGDRASTVFVLAGLSVHPLWLGLLASWFFGHYLNVLPAQGYCTMNDLSTGCDGVARWAEHLVMPWLVFGFVNAALFSSFVRALVHEELGADYVRTAVAKGAGPRRVLEGHVLRNVTVPLLTVTGLTAGTSVVGVVFIESAFDLPGLGGMLRQAVLRRDLPMTAGTVLVLALAVVVLNLLVDLAYTLADPRVRAT
jgi:peptide/nickel transport system permease protein